MQFVGAAHDRQIVPPTGLRRLTAGENVVHEGRARPSKSRRRGLVGESLGGDSGSPIGIEYPRKRLVGSGLLLRYQDVGAAQPNDSLDAG